MRSITSFSLTIVFSLLLGLPVVAESLQKMVDDTPTNGTLTLENKEYEGNIVIDKPMTLNGQQQTSIVGDRTGNVIEIRSDDVVVSNLKIKGSGMSRSSEEEHAGVRIIGDRNTLQNVHISDSYHGIFLNKTTGTVIKDSHVVGHGIESLGNQGNGVHIARSSNNTIQNSLFEKTRDGIFVEYSNENVVTGNTMTETRYGLHYMYSNFNEFKDNRFIKNTGGAAIMHSDHILLENNQFSFNQGSRSFGLIVQTSRDVHVLNNEFHLNQRGLYLEQSTSNTIEGNDFFQNQIGVELWTSSTAHVFFKNHFRKNQIDALTVGGESNNEWFKNGVGNYWYTPQLDFDQDGIGDEPVEYTSALDHLVQENELAYMFLSSPAILIYEKLNALLSSQKIMAYDKYPLMDDNKKPSWMYLLGPIIFLLLSSIFIWNSIRKVKL
ncbi:nitrous oxide reductase family maturation protein NosD [Sporosarcina sp. PTS2304]|uniref:nitrous oxide reductase family maturation protein NosD n=1 Tax=Sporosarcina sp. PTS2304 TaxID=2283194 RepID=UPI000E0DD50D|nr:nitrous oxide reductase family maturation protein NosD [Sporosarcina sp. PTS2304]AXH98281.1 nitrous oxide reductase family maturation protein NosD [Sporosarcina sp. PTS2304]